MTQGLKLYEISEELKPLLDLLDESYYVDEETGEVISDAPGAVVESAINLTALGNEKVARIGFIIRNLEAEAAARKAESVRLSKSAKVHENKVRWLKEYALGYLARSRQKKITTDDGVLTLSVSKGRAKVVIPEGLDCSRWDDEFVKRTVEPRKTPILAAWKESRPFPDGVEIFEGEEYGSVRIK